MPSKGVTTSFSYDANGALIEKTTGAEITTMTYNGMDRLSQVPDPTSHS